MVADKKGKKELFSYLDLPRLGERERIADTIALTVEFMKYQGEVAYEIGKRQAIAMTSTASTIGIGWSAFFFGIAQESWLTSSIGMMVVIGSVFLLSYWTPRMVDSARKSLDDVGAAKFYSKWLADSTKTETAEKIQ
jgi:hypothetical protein